LARAPINRVITDSPSDSSAPATDTAETEAASGEQHMNRLADEIFDRLRWRLAVERERHTA
jgi:hypothetical protein